MLRSLIKNNFRHALDFLLFSNIFIALGATAQALVTYHLLNAKPDLYVLGLLFCSTIAQYNFSILLAKPNHPQQSPLKRIRWIFSHYRLTVSLTIIATFSLIPLFFFLSAASQILLIFLAIVGVTYGLPIFSFNGKKFGLRNIPGIKLFLIAAVWALSCVLLPILELENNHHFAVTGSDTLLLVAKRFLLVAAITIPFDIRDLFQDKTNELKTIPVILGEKKAYLFCQALLFFYIILLFLFKKEFDLDFFGLTITAILTGWLIFKSGWEKNEYYYFLYIDGILIVQFVVLEAVQYISVL